MPVTIHDLHPWDVSPSEAVQLQHELASQIITDQPLALDSFRLVAGVDVSVKEETSRAAVVVLSFPDLRVVEAVHAIRPTTFPYIPGLLSFREGAVIMDAMRQLKSTPDVFVFDGQGIAHPRRIGIASHIGLFVDIPTVGCAKTLLTGKFDPLPETKGSWVPLTRYKDMIGAVVRTRDKTKPVYVSVGNHATLETSIDLVLRCTTRYRLPETTRAAHISAGDWSPQPRLL